MRIQKIADNYGLKVIYDAAHAFGVKCHGESVLNHGDLSVLSFHATKVFNTFEGGAIVCHDAKTKQRIDHLKNFGFVDEVTVVAPGINGKMSEINAAFGMLQLKGINEALHKRKAIDNRYRKALAGVKGIHCLSLQARMCLTTRTSRFWCSQTIRSAVMRSIKNCETTVFMRGAISIR